MIATPGEASSAVVRAVVRENEVSSATAPPRAPGGRASFPVAMRRTTSRGLGRAPKPREEPTPAPPRAEPSSGPPATEMADEIHEANMQRVLAMSADEVAEAQEEIRAMLPAHLVEGARRRGAERLLPREGARSGGGGTAARAPPPEQSCADQLVEDAEAPSDDGSNDGIALTVHEACALARSVVAPQRALAAKKLATCFDDVKAFPTDGSRSAGAEDVGAALLLLVRDRHVSVITHGLDAISACVRSPRAARAWHRRQACGVHRHGHEPFDTALADDSSAPTRARVISELVDAGLVDTLLRLLGSRPLQAAVAACALGTLVALATCASPLARERLAKARGQLVACVAQLLEPRANDPLPYVLTLGAPATTLGVVLLRELLSLAREPAAAATTARELERSVLPVLSGLLLLGDQGIPGLVDVQLEVLRLVRQCLAHGVGLEALASIHRVALEPDDAPVDGGASEVTITAQALSSVTCAVIKWPLRVWVEWFHALSVLCDRVNEQQATGVAAATPQAAVAGSGVPLASSVAAALASHPRVLQCPSTWSAHELTGSAASMHFVATCFTQLSPSARDSGHFATLVERGSAVFNSICENTGDLCAQGAHHDDDTSARACRYDWALAFVKLAVIVTEHDRSLLKPSTRERLARDVERLLDRIEDDNLGKSAAEDAFGKHLAALLCLHGSILLRGLCGDSYVAASHAMLSVALFDTDFGHRFDSPSALVRRGMLLPDEANALREGLAPVFGQALATANLPLPVHWMLLPLASTGAASAATPVVAATLGLLDRLEQATAPYIARVAPATRLFYLMNVCLYSVDVVADPAVRALYSRLFARYAEQCGSGLAEELVAAMCAASTERTSAVVPVEPRAPEVVAAEFVAELAQHFLAQSFGDAEHARSLRLFLRPQFPPKVQLVAWKEVSSAGLVGLLAGDDADATMLATPAASFRCDVELLDVLGTVLLSESWTATDEQSWLHRFALRHVAVACAAKADGAWLRRKCLERAGRDPSLRALLESEIARLSEERG